MTDEHTYWVSIGRNVQRSPLTTGEWLAFRATVREEIANAGATILATVDGASQWHDEEEETCLYLASVPEHCVWMLRWGLLDIAEQYRQEAIGFVGGAPEPSNRLITPNPNNY